MEFQTVHTSASELRRQEREDRLGCRCNEVWQENPGQGVRAGIAARFASGIAADTSATPGTAFAEQLLLDERHERLGS